MKASLGQERPASSPVAAPTPAAEPAEGAGVANLPFWRLPEPVAARVEGESRRLVVEPKTEVLPKAGPPIHDPHEFIRPIHIPLSEYRGS